MSTLYLDIIFSFNNISVKKSDLKPFIFWDKILFPIFSNSLRIFSLKYSFGIFSRYNANILKKLFLFIISKLLISLTIFAINLKYSKKLL